MSANQRRDPKQKALREQGALNRRAERVKDPLFLEEVFFDPRDLVQVKYEMLRRVHREGHYVNQATSAFGVSRPTFYQAQLAFEQEGLSGLVPKKRGPQSRHKLTDEVLEFIAQERAKGAQLRWSELAERVKQRFGVTVHPRSIERTVSRSKKKR